jgi:hypothetical protein
MEIQQSVAKYNSNEHHLSNNSSVTPDQQNSNRIDNLSSFTVLLKQAGYS